MASPSAAWTRAPRASSSPWSRRCRSKAGAVPLSRFDYGSPPPTAALRGATLGGARPGPGSPRTPPAVALSPVAPAPQLTHLRVPGRGARPSPEQRATAFRRAVALLAAELGPRLRPGRCLARNDPRGRLRRRPIYPLTRGHQEGAAPAPRQRCCVRAPRLLAVWAPHQAAAVIALLPS